MAGESGLRPAYHLRPGMVLVLRPHHRPGGEGHAVTAVRRGPGGVTAECGGRSFRFGHGQRVRVRLSSRPADLRDLRAGDTLRLEENGRAVFWRVKDVRRYSGHVQCERLTAGPAPGLRGFTTEELRSKHALVMLPPFTPEEQREMAGEGGGADYARRAGDGTRRDVIEMKGGR